MVVPETTAGERKVIRWFCSVAERGEGRLVFVGRNRLELASRCECARAAAEVSEPD